MLSMIGAIVGEYFGGPTQRARRADPELDSLFDFPRAWAAIVVASAFGIAFYCAVALAERSPCERHPIDTALTDAAQSAAGRRTTTRRV